MGVKFYGGRVFPRNPTSGKGDTRGKTWVLPLGSEPRSGGFTAKLGGARRVFLASDELAILLPQQRGLAAQSM